MAHTYGVCPRYSALICSLSLNAMSTELTATRQPPPPLLTNRDLYFYTTMGAHLIHTSFSLAELLALSGLELTGKVASASLKAAEETVCMIDG